MKSKLKINFVLPFISKTGGIFVVFEHAHQLSKLGHDVKVYHPLWTYFDLLFAFPKWKRPYLQIRQFLSRLRSPNREAAWYPKSVDLKAVPFISAAFFRPADIVIATTWPTAYSVAKFKGSKGKGVYFIQGYEVWTGKAEAVEASYKLGLSVITIAPWLTDLLKTRFNVQPVAEIHNGVDLDFFCPPGTKPSGFINILMLHHTQEVKGVPDGLDVLRRIHQAYPKVRIKTFGHQEFADKDDFIEHHRDPTPERLKSLYQECHIFMSPSLSEGWHLPPMEAMACGCAIVATEVGCIPVLKSENNMLTAAPGDRNQLFTQIERLILDERLRIELSRNGYDTIAQYGWEKKSLELEKALLALS